MGKSLQLSTETWNFLALTISYPLPSGSWPELGRPLQPSRELDLGIGVRLGCWHTWVQPQLVLKIMGELREVCKPRRPQ